MIDTRRGIVLLTALIIGGISTGLPDSLSLPVFLLFGVLALLFIFMPNGTQKRKHHDD